MKKFNLSIILAVMTAACVFLSGCGNSDVNTVKNGTLGNFNTLTIGNALDNYKYFTDTDWRFLETQNGKRVVEFKGIYDPEKLSKISKFKELSLIIQFTMRVQKGFDLTYVGMEAVIENGKTEQRNLAGSWATGCIKRIYKDEDIFTSSTPEVYWFYNQ